MIIFFVIIKILQIIFLFLWLNLIINCAGSTSSTAASSSKPALTYVIAGSESGYALVSRVGARAEVIVSRPLTGGLGFFF